MVYIVYNKLRVYQFPDSSENPIYRYIFITEILIYIYIYIYIYIICIYESCIAIVDTCIYGNTNSIYQNPDNSTISTISGYSDIPGVNGVIAPSSLL